ncbi:TBC1 domain family member 17-like isoform X3 [Gossypium australe]|uniref:TBC1 domain family member 17-like isoform X3 n=1 Tax=Gossypium australe TaxID=47621 RepID=A0A5B6X937_9ROSI|nr:TBC1 domain family member 17-like isoform X3 [Gossypium australe]
MLETEIHDLSDDADYAASQQQGSASMMRCESGKRSSSNEPEGAEVVYMKDNVTIHPTQFASERISGRLKLIKQSSSLFMTWIPYKGKSTNARLSEKDMNLYTIRAVPFADVRSIRRHTPAFGWQYIIVVLSSGLAFPPLYFYNGGVREFLATVKQHAVLLRSAEHANVFLVNDFQKPLQRTLSSLELPRAVSLSIEPSTPVSGGESASQENGERTDVDVLDGSPSIRQFYRRERQKVHDPARDISMQVLEKFSLVTKFAREATAQLFWETPSNAFSLFERGSSNLSAIDSSQKPRDDVLELPVPVPPDPLELDKLSLAWGKPRQPPLGLEEWATFLDSEGRVVDSKALRKRIFYGGVEHKLRKEVWEILLGYQSYESTYAEKEYQRSNKKTEYEIIKNQWQVCSNFFLVIMQQYFLALEGMGFGEREELVLTLSFLLQIYVLGLSVAFESISPEQEKRFTKFRERKGLIEKDVGMSDLLSPILFVMEDESESFWCFVALMERLGPNFNRDQNGMHSQLFAVSKLVELLDAPLHTYYKQKDCLNYFICFRWILLQFKRELEYDQTMRLWEVLWTHHLSEHLHLYVCVALLKRYRGKIIGEQMEFDTLLKFINELSGHIDIDVTLRDAEALCLCAGENGSACIPPGTPPSLPREDGFLFNSELDDTIL